MSKFLNAVLVVTFMLSGFTLGTCTRTTFELKGYDNTIKQSFIAISHASNTYANVITEQLEIFRNK